MQLSYRWVIIAAGALMTCVAAGAMFSLAVFLQPMSLATGWSRAGISSAMTLNFLTMGIAGFVWGSLSDRYGVRIVVLCGAVLLGLALVLASQAASLTAVPAHLRHFGGVLCRRLLCPADCGGHRLVRDQPQPRRLAGFCGLGGGADDDVAVCALADLDLRLAHRHADHRHSGLGVAHPRRAIAALARRRLPRSQGQTGARAAGRRRRPCARYSFGCWR